MNRPKAYSPVVKAKRLTIAMSALALAIGLGGWPSFAAPQAQSQDQSSEPAAASQQPEAQQDQGTPPQQEQAPPPPGQQVPPGSPPYGQGPYRRAPYGYPPQGAPGYPQAGQRQATPPPPLPTTLTIPAGTLVPVRVNDFLSSDQSKVGQIFTASLDEPLLANGWVVARRGQEVTGQVSVAQKSQKGKNNSQLGVVLTEITLVNGQQAAVTTELMQTVAGSSPYDTNRKVGTVAGTTVLGTAIGAIAGGGAGAAIGAGLGATTGGAIVLSTRGRPTVIPREALVTFRLQQPVSVTTSGNQNAFRQAGPQDFGTDQDAYGRYPAPVYGPGYGPAYPPYPGYPPPPVYYYGAYPYAWGYPYYPFYAYPGPFFGVGFGFGPRFGFRGGFRR